jgi:hypothetical protein
MPASSSEAGLTCRAHATWLRLTERRIAMSQDATSDASESTDASATEADDATQVEQTLAEAVENEQQDQQEAGKAEAAKGKASNGEDKLGDGGKRALHVERKARRDAERDLTALKARLQEFEDRDKTELQKAIERAEAAEQGASSMRVENTRLMAAATHNIPPDLIDLLGNGTDEEIDARAKLLAEKLAATAPAPAPAEPEKKAPAQTRPVESLTAGGQPAGQTPLDMDAFIRGMAGRT